MNSSFGFRIEVFAVTKEIYSPINSTFSEFGRLNGFDKNLSVIPLNNSMFEAGAKCVAPGIMHNCALGILL